MGGLTSWGWPCYRGGRGWKGDGVPTCLSSLMASSCASSSSLSSNLSDRLSFLDSASRD